MSILSPVENIKLLINHFLENDTIDNDFIVREFPLLIATINIEDFAVIVEHINERFVYYNTDRWIVQRLFSLDQSLKVVDTVRGLNKTY